MPELSLTERASTVALRAFLLTLVPAGTPVIRAQVNRVPEPKETNFVVMSPLTRVRLSTNVANYQDCQVLGSILGDVLTVTDVDYGAVTVGAIVYTGTGAPGAHVEAMITGTGGVGTYRVAPAQNAPEQPMWLGIAALLQPIELTYQLDFHGPSADDTMQIVSTAMVSSEGFDFFRDLGLDMRPLYVSDPRETPFINGEDQYEFRWILDTAFQVNPIVTLPQQFADKLQVDVINVDAEYPL